MLHDQSNSMGDLEQNILTAYDVEAQYIQIHFFCLRRLD